VDEVVELCRPVAGRWLPAARHGLADSPVAAVARRVLELGLARLPDTGLPKEVAEPIANDLDRVLHRATSNGGTPR
jgi:glutamate--cysteine ligase